MKDDFYVVCENIRSLENIGSIFRTADAVRVKKIFLCGISGLLPHPNIGSGGATLHPKIAKSALGAEKTVPFEYHKQTWRLINKLKNKGIGIIALEQSPRSISYIEFKPHFPLALVIGNEVKGVSKKVLEKADKVICLPMHGKKESLNVAVAFGIAAYHIRIFNFPWPAGHPEG